MKKIIFTALLIMHVVIVFAQPGNGVSGKVIDSKTKTPLQSVMVSIQNTTLMQLTDETGKFYFPNVAIGDQLLLIRSNGYKDQLLQVERSEERRVGKECPV